MRQPSRTICIGCCLLALVAGGHTAVAQTAQAAAQPFGDVWLEGTVGSATIRAYVGDAGWPKSEGLWGIFYDTRDWSPVPLEGDWTPPGRIRLFEGDPSDKGPKPRFDLSLSESAVDGTWTSADGQKTLRVQLRRVPKPAPFEVAIRRARHFTDARWPITLSYPADWRLDVSDSDLELRSPDPEDMLFDNNLSCVRGRGLPSPPGPEEPPEELEWPWFRGSSTWLFDSGSSGDCTTDKCEVAKSEQRGAGTFLRGDVGYRMFGPWKYQGLAEFNAYLIVVGQEWVACRDRLLDSDTRIAVAGTDRREE